MSWQRGLRPAPPPLNPEDDDDYFRGYGSMGRHYGQYGSWGRHRTPNYHNMTQRDGECTPGTWGGGQRVSTGKPLRSLERK